MKYKKGDCFLASKKLQHWGTAVIVGDARGYSTHFYYPIIWTGLAGTGPFEWAESSLDALQKATKLHKILAGVVDEV